MTAPFIVLEGLDGAGTTTQVRRLKAALQHRDFLVHTTCEPSTGPIGKMIRQMLRLEIAITNDHATRPVSRETLACLFAADRLHHIDAEIEPLLRQNTIVISDRYYHSSLVYQGDIDGDDGDDGDGDDGCVDYDWVLSLNQRARTPDLTIFLKAPVELCLQRLQDRLNFEIYETADKLRRLETRYDEVISLARSRGEAVEIIPADQPIDTITALILDALQAHHLL